MLANLPYRCDLIQNPTDQPFTEFTLHRPLSGSMLVGMTGWLWDSGYLLVY